MNAMNYKLSLDHAKSQMRFYRAGMFMGLLAVIFLSVTVIFVSGRERTIVVPPEMSKTFWVDNSNVSREYLEEMALHITQLELTVTPSSFKFQSEQLLRYIHPSAYGDMRSTYAARQVELSRDGTSYWFTPQEVKTEVSKKIVFVRGEIVTYVGDKQIQKTPKTYMVEFAYVNSRLYLKTFKEATNADQKSASNPAAGSS